MHLNKLQQIISTFVKDTNIEGFFFFFNSCFIVTLKF